MESRTRPGWGAALALPDPNKGNWAAGRRERAVGTAAAAFPAESTESRGRANCANRSSQRPGEKPSVPQKSTEMNRPP